MRFADWFRQQEGLTQEALAQRLGVTQGRIAQIIAGEMPSMRLAARISEITEGKVMPNDFLRLPPATERAAS